MVIVKNYFNINVKDSYRSLGTFIISAFHTYGQFMVPLRACRIHISLQILCTGRCQLRLAGVVSSVQPLPFVFLCIATQSVRFVFPRAFFLS